MSDQPASVHAELIDTILKTYGTVVDGRTAVYVSAPITTGLRFAEWRSGLVQDDVRHSSLKAQHRERVVIPNIAAAREVVRRVRRTFSETVVIDPTALPDLPGWGQSEYRELWRHVVERFAKIVVFVDGWQFSEGCCYEYWVAHSSGATTLDSKSAPLPPGQALELIRAAIESQRVAGIETTFLADIRDKLSEATSAT